jgi:uncharacterized membrane protein YjgN (DUF898 family)
MNDAIVPPHLSADPLPAAGEAPVASPVTFTGVRRDFWRLIVRGAFLELITLGFYRFWLATDMRRHFWSHTALEGDSPEYTGTAMELFIGFLIALAILLPLNLAYFFLTLEAELWKAFASIPLILFFYLFFQFARYRARRYRLTRTVWRGVRFWMKGSGWDYAWRAGLWMLAAIVSLGLALPWSTASLERFKIRNTFYGDLPARFEATGSALFRKVWWLWLPVLPLMLVAYGLVFVGLWAVFDWRAVADFFKYVAAMMPGAQAGVQASAVATGYFTLLSLWAVFAFAIYKAHEWRWWLSGIRFGDVRFESKLSDIALVDLYWIVIGWSWAIMMALFVWIMLVFGFGYLLARALGGTGPDAFAALAEHAGAMALLVGVGVLGYLACALALGTVMRMYLRRDVWARVVASTVVYNLAAADDVVARGDTVNALGEGFADGLDIGGF